MVRKIGVHGSEGTICLCMGRSHENSGGLRLSELYLSMRIITTLHLSFCGSFFKPVAILFRRHPVRIPLKNSVLLIRKPWVLFLVPTRRFPIIGFICEEAGVDVNPLDSAARLGGHWGWEVDLWAFHFVHLIIIKIVI